MAFQTATVTGHYAFFEAMRAFVAAQGWQELQYSSAANRLVWWKAPGLTGLEEIFVGMRTYQDTPTDYYNISVFGAIGHTPGGLYSAQPGFSGAKGVPLWNQPITYWAVCNGQRLCCVCKVQNVYESFYIGKFLPYANPSQYPYPLFVGGMLDDETNTRYSDTFHTSWWKGANNHSFKRFLDGSWGTQELWPYNNVQVSLRNTNTDAEDAAGSYGLYPVVLNSGTGDPNVFGELDGVFFISGYNNAAENTLLVDGVTYLVTRDVTRTGIRDYMALRLD